MDSRRLSAEDALSALAKAALTPAAGAAVLAVGLVTAWLVPTLHTRGGEPIKLVPGLDFGASLVLVLGLLAVLAQALAFVLRRSASLMRPQRPYYRKVTLDWLFLNREGELQGTLLYDVVNGAKQSRPTLPREEIILYRPPSGDEITFRLVLRKGGSAHRLPNDDYALADGGQLKLQMKFEREHLLSWEPEIVPAMEPGEPVSYEVGMVIPDVEVDMFTPGGSTFGFPVHHPCEATVLIGRAPPNHRFELLEPVFVIKPIGGGERLRTLEASTPAPELIGTGGRFSWTVPNPRLDARYAANVRIVRA